MVRFLKKHKITLFLTFLILIGAFLRFYNLNWGAPFYFHPDERNIAHAVTQLKIPDQLNPNFFAYGSLPIYIIYVTGIIKNIFFNIQNLTSVSFPDAIIISRFYSAIFSVGLIPLIFVIARNLVLKQSLKNKAGLLAAFLTTFSTGLIQFSHFGTFEMWITFFSTLLFLLTLNYLKNPNSKTTILIGLIFGILFSIKISSLVLLPIPLLVIFLAKSNKNHIAWGSSFLFIIISAIVFFITNPFTILDYVSFQNSMNYETSLAVGSLPVFYTGGFYNTIPVLYQFTKIYPFLLNPVITFIFIPSLIYLVINSIKTKNKSYLLLIAFFLLLFFSQAFLFAKWTRYMMPTLPFAYLIIAIAISNSLKYLSKTKELFSIKYFVLSIIINSSLIFSISYFITAFVKPDTRTAAANFAESNIASNSRILTEPYDLGITPFNANYQNIRIFNFYELENKSDKSNSEKLSEVLANSDYIILPSQRIYRNRILNPNQFPLGNNFYKNLINEKLGYKKIYETPCDIFCKITYLDNPIFTFEETASVFDHPIIMIFKK